MNYLQEISFFIAGGMCGVVLMSILFFAKSESEDSGDLLSELEKHNLSLSRIEDGLEVFWLCSNGYPRMIVGEGSTNPRLAIISAVKHLEETHLVGNAHG